MCKIYIFQNILKENFMFLKNEKYFGFLKWTKKMSKILLQKHSY